MACGGHGDDEFHAPVCDVVFSIFKFLRILTLVIMFKGIMQYVHNTSAVI